MLRTVPNDRARRCESCGATSADKCVCGVHSCSYECDRPACVRRQRDELRAHLYALYDKKEVMRNDAGQLPEPRPVAPPGLSSDGPGVSKVALLELRYYVKKDEGSRWAYVMDRQRGQAIERFNILKRDGWPRGA